MSSILNKMGVAKHIAPECPSELNLDRLSVDELEANHPIRAHVSDCEECKARMSERSRLLPLELKSRMLAEIHRGVVERKRTDRWLDRLIAMLSPVRHFAVVAATACAVFFMFPRERPEAVTSKGGLGLVVYRERGGDVDKTLSGEQFQPGDRLRFEVELPQPGQLMIVGVEADGDTFPCYTSESERSVIQTETNKHLLPGAVELDDSRGKEQLHAILCRTPFSFGDVHVEDGRVVSPPDCMSTPFILDKEIE
jgi:hypothetical protein